MNKLVAEIYRIPSGGFSPQLFCEREDGTVDRAVTDTLCCLISEMDETMASELNALIAANGRGEYSPRNPRLPDWGVNDKNVWLVAPMATNGHICISNEYTEEYASEEGGLPQQFTYHQFSVAWNHWRAVADMSVREGKENLVGRRYEAEFPDI